MATRCWTCGTTYTGFECPSCSLKKSIADASSEIAEAFERDAEARAQQAAEYAEAAAEAASQVQRSIETATRQQQHDIANAWKLQSGSQATRALELLQAGLLNEALGHVLEAIRLDRANLEAYRTAQLIHEKRGESDQAFACARTQVQLLKVAPFNASSGWHRWVLEGLPPHEDLLNLFTDAAVGHVRSWSWSNDTAQLVEECLKRKLNRLARIVIEGSSKTQMSAVVALAAYATEVNRRLGASASRIAIEPFLASLAADKRLDTTKSLVDLEQRSKQLSPEALAELRAALVIQYDDWWPQIEASLSTNARVAADAARQDARFATTFGWIVGLMTLFGLGFVFQAITKGRSLDDRAFGAPPALGWLVAAISAGLFTSSLTRDRAASRVWDDRLRQAIGAELQGWKDLFKKGGQRGSKILGRLQDLEGRRRGANAATIVAGCIVPISAAAVLVTVLSARPEPFAVGDVVTASHVQGWKQHSDRALFRRGDAVCGYAEALNVLRPSGTDVEFRFTVLSPLGAAIEGKPQRIRLDHRTKSPHVWGSDCLALPGDTAPGDYRMSISIRDNLTGQVEAAERPFKVTNAVAAASRMRDGTSQWVGDYVENGTFHAFSATFTVRRGELSGQTVEQRGPASRPARLSGRVENAAVEFTKTYDDARPNVLYQGEVNADGTCARGSWTLGPTSGSWKMRRIVRGTPSSCP